MNHLNAFIDWLLKTIFAIGLITIAMLIKLNITGSVSFNPDIFKNTWEVKAQQVLIDKYESFERNEQESLAEAQSETKKR